MNGTAYATLAEALTNITGGTITLVDDKENAGLQVPEATEFTLDLGGNTLTLKNPTTGSPGTETLGCQFLKGSSITIKNGVITSEDAKMLIQNYSDLTLDNVQLIGTPNNQYVLSNNFGNVILKNGTKIVACGDNVAFDVYYGMSSVYDDGVTVTIADPSVKIEGRIEYGKASRADATAFAEKARLTVPVGYALDAPAGYEWVDNNDGTQSLKAVA